MARVGVREGAHHLEQLGGSAVGTTERRAEPRRDGLSVFASLGCISTFYLERDDRALVGRVRAKKLCACKGGSSRYLPRMAIGKNKKLSKGRKGGKKKLCARPPPPLNRFLSLLRPPPAPALSSSMDILDTRARWGAQRGPVLAQGVVRRQGAVHLRRPQCREDVREPDAGDEYAARPPPPSARYRGWLSSESSPRSRIAFVSDV